MSLVKTGKIAHDTEVARSEGILQSAVGVAGISQATANAAAIAHYRNCLASARLNGVDMTVFIQALRDLGTGGA